MPAEDVTRKARSGRRRTPTVIQMEAAECGAASLGMILAYHGRFEPLEKLRLACGVSRDGSNAGNVVRAARHFGLEARGFAMGPAELRELAAPFVVFWEFNHFLVVEGHGRKGWWVNDPASGPRLVSDQDFDTSYTGVVLTFQPGPAFQPGGAGPSLLRSLARRARGLGDLGDGVEQAEHRLHVDEALLDLAVHPAEHVERAEQLREQRVDQHHVADREPAFAPAPDRVSHGAAHHDVGDQRLADVERGERVLALDRRTRVGEQRLAVAVPLQRFRAVVFHRLVVEQRIDGALRGAVVGVHHAAAKLAAPFGDAAREGDVERHHDERRGDDLEAHLDLEDHADGDQFEDRRRDVEGEEVEHRVDALGAALDDAGERAGAAFEVEAQAEVVDAREHLGGEVGGGRLPDALEDHVADVVEQHAAETRRRIGEDEADAEQDALARGCRHRIDGGLVREGHDERRRLGDEHEDERSRDAQLQARLVGGPEIGEETAQRMLLRDGGHAP